LADVVTDTAAVAVEDIAVAMVAVVMAAMVDMAAGTVVATKIA
jgi:hypothetical protein